MFCAPSLLTSLSLGVSLMLSHILKPDRTRNLPAHDVQYLNGDSLYLACIDERGGMHLRVGVPQATVRVRERSRTANN